jgi:threonine/homoserine/homoserine lactone efflux protein
MNATSAPTSKEKDPVSTAYYAMLVAISGLFLVWMALRARREWKERKAARQTTTRAAVAPIVFRQTTFSSPPQTGISSV